MRILIAATPLLAFDFGDYLERRGHTVCYATSGALALLFARTRKFDVTFLAANLPDMSGQTVCRVMRRMLHIQTPPLVLLDPDADASRCAMEDGADVCMVGILDYDVLHEHVLRLGTRAEDGGCREQGGWTDEG